MAFLKITSGEMEGHKVEITQAETSIGRSDQNTLALDDPAISAKHCVVLKDDKKYTIKDLHSTNGTRLNGKNITEARLRAGDIIITGAIEILIDGPDIEVEQKSEPTRSDGPLPTIICIPPRSTSRSVSGIPLSPAFQTKRDNKPLIIGLIVIIFILVAVAMGWFFLQVFKK